MTQPVSTQLSLGVVVTLVSVLGASTPALAQAWTPAQGEGIVSIEYRNAFYKYHLMPDGTAQDRGHVRSEAMLVDFSYGISDKLAVTVALPFVAARYQGPHPHPTALDNGDYHSTFQDLQFGVSYNISRKGLVVTPFVGTIIPSHAYEYYAHAAPGRDLRELQVGAYWAKLLDPLLPGLFVTGRYSYGFTQRVLDISHDRSNIDLEMGYFVKQDFRVFAMGAGQLTHGGIGLYPADLYPSVPPLSAALQRHHDQIGNDDMLNVGGGAAYSLTPSLDVFGSVIHTLTGKNAHALQYGATMGVSWSFMTRHAVPHASRSTAAERATGEAHKLLKCVCQKGR